MHLQLQQLECKIEALQFQGSAIGRDHRRDSRNHSPENSRTRYFPGTQCCPEAASDRAFPGPCQKPTDATRNSSAPESGVHATPLIPPWIWRLAGFSEAWFGARTGWLLLRRRSGGRGHRAAAAGGSERVGEGESACLDCLRCRPLHSSPVQSRGALWWSAWAGGGEETRHSTGKTTTIPPCSFFRFLFSTQRGKRVSRITYPSQNDCLACNKKGSHIWIKLSFRKTLKRAADRIDLAQFISKTRLKTIYKLQH